MPKFRIDKNCKYEPEEAQRKKNKRNQKNIPKFLARDNKIIKK